MMHQCPKHDMDEPTDGCAFSPDGNHMLYVIRVADMSDQRLVDVFAWYFCDTDSLMLFSIKSNPLLLYMVSEFFNMDTLVSRATANNSCGTVFRTDILEGYDSQDIPNDRGPPLCCFGLHHRRQVMPVGFVLKLLRTHELFKDKSDAACADRVFLTDSLSAALLRINTIAPPVPPPIIEEAATSARPSDPRKRKRAPSVPPPIIEDADEKFRPQDPRKLTKEDAKEDAQYDGPFGDPLVPPFGDALMAQPGPLDVFSVDDAEKDDAALAAQMRTQLASALTAALAATQDAFLQQFDERLNKRLDTAKRAKTDITALRAERAELLSAVDALRVKCEQKTQEVQALDANISLLGGKAAEMDHIAGEYARMQELLDEARSELNALREQKVNQEEMLFQAEVERLEKEKAVQLAALKARFNKA